MSSYLHRLVQTVAHPHETVHPRTGSLFAPYRSESESPTELWEQAEMVTAHPAHSESSTIIEPAETPRPPARSDYSQSPLFPGNLTKPPLMAQLVQRADVSPPATNGALDTFEHAVDLPQRPVASKARRAVPDSRRDAGVQSYTPLIEPQGSRANSTPPETTQLSTEAGGTREAGANVPLGRPNRAGREPDEIQIHIGRIEVTAVQAPAPRAPRAPDTGISLDAYLERRNGRAR